MKYKVIWRSSLNPALSERFGARGSVHELTDSEVLALIREFGRASLDDGTGYGLDDADSFLYFEDDYD